MEPLRVNLFRDGRPGHEKQARGIVSALQRYRPLEIRETAISRGSPITELRRWARFVLGLQVGPVLGWSPDLLIGAGSRTHLAILSCKRRYGGYAVVCMSPARPIRNRFDLCFVPAHDRIAPATNVFVTVGPPNLAEIYETGETARHRDRGLILVGGVDSGSHCWDEQRLVEQIGMLLRHQEVSSWLISSSPRTPATTEALLERLASTSPAVAFYPFSQTAPGWVEQQYRLHHTVWVTADSISMIYEALSAGCRVGILPVQWKRSNTKFSYSEQLLIEERRVMAFDRWSLGHDAWPETQPLDEADRCAREMVRRWWSTD